jgi:hypothetical protein
MVCFYGRIGLLLMKMCTLGVQSSKWKTFWRDNPWFALRESDLYKWEMTGVYRVWFIYIWTRPYIHFVSVIFHDTWKNHLLKSHISILIERPSWPWWYSSWIYNGCNMCLSPLMLWVRISIRRGVQHYVIKFISDLRQVSGFLRVLRFPPPIKLTATIWLKYCWKWC